MRCVLLLLIAATTVFGQDQNIAAAGTKYLIRVRAADTTKQATMRIAIDGHLFGSLGASRVKPYGGVTLAPEGSSGYGTVVGSLFARPGRITFSSNRTGPELELVVTAASGAPTPRLVARGTTVSVDY